MTSKASRAGLAMAIAALAGCGGDKPVGPGQPTAADTVHVSPDTLALDLDGVPHNRLWLTLAHAMGLDDLETFGTEQFCADGPLRLS